MSDNKDKYEIVRTFKSLLKKAEEMSQEKKRDGLIEKKKFPENRKALPNDILFGVKKSLDIKNDRLGIKNIKRLPHDPFMKRTKFKGQEYEDRKKALKTKISNILNKHIYYWLKREMPKYVKIKLRKNIYSLLINLKKK